MVKFMTQQTRIKYSKGNINCIYCNNSCNPDIDEFVIKRRKTINWFHKRCYYVYKQLGFNPIDEERSENVKS